MLKHGNYVTLKSNYVKKPLFAILHLENYSLNILL